MEISSCNTNLVYYDEVLSILKRENAKLTFLEGILKTKSHYKEFLLMQQEIMMSLLEIRKEKIIIKEGKKIEELMTNLKTICYYQMVYLKRLKSTSQDYEEVMRENRELFIKKNKDYGNSFEDFGLLGIVVRLNDKINRIKSLMMTNELIEVKDESIDDSVNDLYNYCVLGLMYMFKKGK